MEETKIATHEYIRRTIKALEAAAENLEYDLARLRRAISALYASAEDVQTLEEIP